MQLPVRRELSAGFGGLYKTAAVQQGNGRRVEIKDRGAQPQNGRRQQFDEERKGTRHDTPLPISRPEPVADACTAALPLRADGTRYFIPAEDGALQHLRSAVAGLNELPRMRHRVGVGQRCCEEAADGGAFELLCHARRIRRLPRPQAYGGGGQGLGGDSHGGMVTSLPAFARENMGSRETLT